MLCQHVQNTQLIQNNILEKLSVPDETENIVYYTRESRLSFSIKLYIYFSWGLSRSHHCYRHWIKRIFLRFIFVFFATKIYMFVVTIIWIIWNYFFDAREAASITWKSKHFYKLYYTYWTNGSASIKV